MVIFTNLDSILNLHFKKKNMLLILFKLSRSVDFLLLKLHFIGPYGKGRTPIELVIKKKSSQVNDYGVKSSLFALSTCRRVVN